MVDEQTVRELSRLLGAAGRAHHQAVGGPNPGWPEWYASQVHPEIARYVGFEPTVDQVAEWLREAEARHREDAPEDRWPAYYARWILESVEA